MAVETTAPSQADGTNNLLRKILLKLNTGLGLNSGGGNININASGIEQITDGTAQGNAQVTTSVSPSANAPALVVKNIPTGTQNVSIVGGLPNPLPVSSADGALVSVGATTDAAAPDSNANGTVIAELKGLLAQTIAIKNNSDIIALRSTQILGSSQNIENYTNSTQDVLHNGCICVHDDTLTGVISGGINVTVVGGIPNPLPVSVADGADVTQGAKADAAVTNPASTASVVALLKGILTGVNTPAGSGGATALIKETITTGSGAYAGGQNVGGKITISNAVRSAGTAILESITVLDKTNQKAPLEFLIFDADPTNATLTDLVAFAFNADDVKCIARIPIYGSDYVSLGTEAIATLRGLGATLKAASGTTLYGCLVYPGTGTPTWNAGSKIQLTIGLLQD